MKRLIRLTVDKLPKAIGIDLRPVHFLNGSYESNFHHPITRAVREYFQMNGYSTYEIDIVEHCFETSVILYNEFEVIYKHPTYIRKDYLEDRAIARRYFMGSKCINEMILTKSEINYRINNIRV